MKRLMLALGMAALLAACTSTPLDTPPVEDKKGTAVQTAGAGSGDQSKVTGVNLTNTESDLAGPKGDRIVYFDFDSYVIKPEFQAIIENHARFIKANKGRKVSIEGHTDEQGGREYNLALGQRRSEAVRKALGLLGVNDSQLEAVSFGKEKPAALGHDDAAMAKNRRAEITYR